jgi:NAD(P)H-flavin reductase
LSNYAILRVLDNVKRLRGVGNAVVFGSQNYSMRLILDPIRMAQLSLTPTDIVNVVREQNRDFPAGTRALARLKKGDPILLRGPFGTPWPVEAARGHDVVIVAGGIGLAPLRPVLYHIAAHRADFGKVCLLYGARTPQDVLYPTELAQWGNKRQMQVAVTVDRGDETWRGDVGVVTRLLDRAVFDPKQTVAMVCGPEIMMHFGRLALEKRGVAAEQMYLSMERNMKCGVGTCGHCQLGPFFLCKDGPVLPFSTLRPYFSVREL